MQLWTFENESETEYGICNFNLHWKHLLMHKALKALIVFVEYVLSWNKPFPDSPKKILPTMFHLQFDDNQGFVKIICR